jgi:Predicted membrane protein (DUF2142)
VLSVRLALAAGLAVAAAALGLVLARPPLNVVAGADGVPANPDVGFTRGGEVSICQSAGTVPAGTEAVRVSLSANVGPRVSVKISRGASVVASGVRAPGWGADETVTVPVARVAKTIAFAGACTTVGKSVEQVQINGTRVTTPAGPHALWLRMEYLRPGPRSWLSLASSVADRMGFARAPSGAWVAWLAVALMLAAALLAARLALREGVAAARAPRTALRPPAGPPAGPRDAPPAGGEAPPAPRRFRRAALTCALVAFLSAASWSLVTPPFQFQDEPSHFAYAQLLAETGRLPRSPRDTFSWEEEHVLKDLHQREVRWHPEVGTIASPAARRRLAADLARPLSRSDALGAGVAASQPPLYYALETVPYRLASSGNLLDRLEAMRLLSALFAALSALFVFLFLREALPRAPWAWTAAGLSAALLPLLGFTSGAVTPDSLLCAVCAALFFAFARAFRRGLSFGNAAAIGALIALGFLSKLNFVGLAPGTFLGLVVLARRARPSAGSAGPDGPDGGACGPGAGSSAPLAGRPLLAYGPLALGLAVAVGPGALYVLDNLLFHHHAFGIVTVAMRGLRKESIVEELAYAWQLYLPRLPGMSAWFPGLSTLRDVWFNRTVGLYGWLDTDFPVWACNLALIPAALLALLCLRSLLARRAALRARSSEILVYLSMASGLLLLIALDSHLNRLIEGASYAEPRYLLPLLPLAAALLALAARGAGRRLGPAAGALIVVLFLAHDVFSQLLVVARFYG